MNAHVDDNPPLVFQASSGDSNPNDMKRIVGLVGLYKRQHFDDKETGNKVVNKLAGMVEAIPVKQRTYELTSAPMLNKLAMRADKFLDKASPRWGGGRIGNIVSDIRKSVDDFERTTQETMDGNIKDTPPVLPVPRKEDRAKWEEIKRKINGRDAVLAKLKADKSSAFEQWVSKTTPSKVADMSETPAGGGLGAGERGMNAMVGWRSGVG
jgi:hypothetical protein